METSPPSSVSSRLEKDHPIDYSKRSQWLRAAVLGAIDGLISTASLMVGIGAVKKEFKPMILTGFAGLLAGACSMAIGEFVSVHSQLDIQVAQREREIKNSESREDNDKDEKLPSPIQAAAASALTFVIGAVVPLMAAMFVRRYKIRVVVVVSAVSVMLGIFGWVAASLGKVAIRTSTTRVVVGGWLAMGITFGITKLIGSTLGFDLYAT